MRHRLIFAVLSACILCLTAAASARAAAPSTSTAAAALSAQLAPLAWLQGTWIAQPPPPPGKPPLVIEEHFKPVLKGQALGFETLFNGAQQYMGFFVYDPIKKTIVFWYPSSEGEITTGVVSQTPGYLLFDFTVTSPNGGLTPMQVHLQPTGANDYDWTLFSQTGADWHPLFTLHYHRKTS